MRPLALMLLVLSLAPSAALAESAPGLRGPLEGPRAEAAAAIDDELAGGPASRAGFGRTELPEAESASLDAPASGLPAALDVAIEAALETEIIAEAPQPARNPQRRLSWAGRNDVSLRVPSAR